MIFYYRSSEKMIFCYRSSDKNDILLHGHEAISVDIQVRAFSDQQGSSLTINLLTLFTSPHFLIS